MDNDPQALRRYISARRSLPCNATLITMYQRAVPDRYGVLYELSVSRVLVQAFLQIKRLSIPANLPLTRHERYPNIVDMKIAWEMRTHGHTWKGIVRYESDSRRPTRGESGKGCFGLALVGLTATWKCEKLNLASSLDPSIPNLTQQD